MDTPSHQELCNLVQVNGIWGLLVKCNRTIGMPGALICVVISMVSMSVGILLSDLVLKSINSFVWCGDVVGPCST